MSTQLDLDDVAGQSKLAVKELEALRNRVKELEVALESLVVLYNDDIGMDCFPDSTQVEIKSTTFGVLRTARKALKK